MKIYLVGMRHWLLWKRPRIGVGKFRFLLLLLPCTWVFFSVGKKRLPTFPITSRCLYNPSVGRPVCHMIDWFIDCYRQVGVNNPTRSHTQTPSVFTGLRNYWCQNQFIPQGGWAGENFEFVLNSFISQIPGWPGCHVTLSFLHVVITLTDLEFG